MNSLIDAHNNPKEILANLTSENKELTEQLKVRNFLSNRQREDESVDSN